MFKPLHFIGESVEVHFLLPLQLEKKPGCPDAFTWRGTTYHVQELLSEWHDYRRRGRMARNMQPQHASVAERRGSWGVGQDYFRVRVEGERVFDIYYDRAPDGVDRRKGGWYLDKEVSWEE